MQQRTSCSLSFMVYFFICFFFETGKCIVNDAAEIESIAVELAVRSLKSGEWTGQMDANMYAALSADAHAAITFESSSVQRQQQQQQQQQEECIEHEFHETWRVEGALCVAGTRRERVGFDMRVDHAQSDKTIENKNIFIVSGKLPLNMLDFNVQPPSMLLLKTYPDINISWRISLLKSNEKDE